MLRTKSSSQMFLNSISTLSNLAFLAQKDLTTEFLSQMSRKISTVAFLTRQASKVSEFQLIKST